MTEDRYSAAHPSSRLRLCIYAKRFAGKDILAGMLEIPLDSFDSSSQNDHGPSSFLHISYSTSLNTSIAESEIPFVLKNPDVARPPTIYLKIDVSADSATSNTSCSGIQGVDNSLANTLTATFVTSDPVSSLQDGLHIGSGSATTSVPGKHSIEMLSTEKILDEAATFAASDSVSGLQDELHAGSGSLAEKDSIEMLSTEKALDEADQAVNSMQPVLGSMAIMAANIITTVPDVIDDGTSVYKAWENAITTMKAVMVIVDKIAEVVVNCLPMIELNFFLFRFIPMRRWHGASFPLSPKCAYYLI